MIHFYESLVILFYSVAGGGSTATTFLIGVFGICAIKFDCKELLIVSFSYYCSGYSLLVILA